MTRRAFFARAAGAAVGLALVDDPERLLWTPGKMISIPQRRVCRYSLIDACNAQQHAIDAQISEQMEIIRNWRPLTLIGPIRTVSFTYTDADFAASS